MKPITLARYSQAVHDFVKWASKHRRSLGPSMVDRTLVDYLHVCCEEGMSIVAARSTVYGYIMLKLDSALPERMLLAQSKSALKGWSTRFPHHSRAGVDLQIWDVIAWQCIKTCDALVAAAILLQGDTYMRPHEILQVRAASVIKPSKSKARFWGIVIGDQDFGTPTKAGLFDDCVLLNSPGRSDLGIVLKYLLATAKDESDFLFRELTLSAYNKAIKKACEKLGLHRLNLTPHHLRHSGPSSDVLHKVRSLSAIQQRGRWASSSSVARYQKPGRMLLLHQLIPQSIWDSAAKCRSDCLDFFRRNAHKNA